MSSIPSADILTANERPGVIVHFLCIDCLIVKVVGVLGCMSVAATVGVLSHLLYERIRRHITRRKALASNSILTTRDSSPPAQGYFWLVNLFIAGIAGSQYS
jgi:hypothetical protein